MEFKSVNSTYEDKSEKVPLLPSTEFTGSQPRAQNPTAPPLSSHLEDSPAYQVLQGLLVSDYRVASATSIKTIPGTSSRYMNVLSNCLCCWVCGVRTFDVPNGHVKLSTDGSGGFVIYGPGVHMVRNPFLKHHGPVIPLSTKLISHGDRTIVTIQQGHVGYCEDMGQPVLLPPGLHEWDSPTLRFMKSIDLNNTLIKLGPYTLITVDEGYAAVTQNNGKQVILEGGKTHLLSHRNWKFEKFMTEKIQTDDLERIEATSADNVKMHTFATVVWRVTDVQSAARMSAETMRHDGNDISQADQSDMSKLRNDVLKQATASLACFIGEIRYSDSFHISAQITRGREASSNTDALKPPVPDDLAEYSPIWDPKRMATAVEIANKVTRTYGISILSINIISAIPADTNLQNALAKGAVASAEAEQAETIARGEAKAAKIKAEGDAEANVIRAEGARIAAEKLASSDIAVELARIDKVGEVLGEKTTFFFGGKSSAQDLQHLLSNPAIVTK